MMKKALHALHRFERDELVTVCGIRTKLVRRRDGRWKRIDPNYPCNREAVTCRHCLRFGGPGVHAISHAVAQAYTDTLRA